VIIRDLYFVSISSFPPKADAPLVIDADALLALSVAPQRFQMVSRRRRHIAQHYRGMQLVQLP
jgi:hypothetical protein